MSVGSDDDGELASDGDETDVDDIAISPDTAPLSLTPEHTRFIYQTIIDCVAAGSELCTPQRLHARLIAAARDKFGCVFTTKQIRNVLSNLEAKATTAAATITHNKQQVDRCAREYDAALKRRQRTIAAAKTRSQAATASAVSPVERGQPIIRQMSSLTQLAPTASNALARIRADGAAEKEKTKARKAEEQAAKRTRKRRRGSAATSTSSVPTTPAAIVQSDIAIAPAEPSAPVAAPAAADDQPAYKKAALTSSTLLLNLSKAIGRQHDRFEGILDLVKVHIEKQGAHMEEVSEYNKQTLKIQHDLLELKRIKYGQNKENVNTINL